MIGGLERVLATKEIVVVCGSGGVGKTTIAAATATMAAARLSGRVLVLTVDPARRLADALGLEMFGNTERQIEPSRLGGSDPAGELWAAMLDTKASWDDLVRQHAPSDEVRDRILANSLYQTISARFVQSHDYIAMERLYELHQTGRYDLIVVDTPPSRNAIDFLDAPTRMADFFGGRLVRWLTIPYRSRLATMASRPFFQVADRILGRQFLEDIAEFFMLFQTMHDGFIERARAVERLIADRRSTFIVVSTPEAAPAREAEFFLDALARRSLPLGAVVLNRVLPDLFDDPSVGRAADVLVGEGAAIAREVAPLVDADASLVGPLLGHVGENHRNFALARLRERDVEITLSRPDVPLLRVPWIDRDTSDLEGLFALGGKLWSNLPG